MCIVRLFANTQLATRLGKAQKNEFLLETDTRSGRMDEPMPLDAFGVGEQHELDIRTPNHYATRCQWTHRR